MLELIRVKDERRTLLQLEFFHSLLVRSDGRAFDAYAMLEYSLSGVNGDLVVGLISVRKTQVVVFQVNIKIWVNELFLDILPDDARHLIAIKFDDRVLDLDLLGSSS